MIIRWRAPAIRTEGEDVTEAEDTDALGVSRGVPTVGDTVIDATDATAGADEIGALPISIGLDVGLAVAVDVGVGRGVPPVGDTVIDDTDTIAGADDIDALPISIGLDVGLAVDVGVGVSRGVPTVGDTVIGNTDATEGASVATELGVTAEYVTFLIKRLSHR